MPPLAGYSVRAGKNLAVDRNPASRAGSEDDTEDDAAARTSAVRRFGEREAVGVVPEAHGAPQVRLDVTSQRPAIQPRRVRVLYETGCGRDRSGDADADARGDADGALEIRHQRRDRRDRLLVAAARRRSANAVLNRARLVEHDALDLRSAEINPNAHGSPYIAGADTVVLTSPPRCKVAAMLMD